MIKKCLKCGIEFESKYAAKRKFCSNKCYVTSEYFKPSYGMLGKHHSLKVRYKMSKSQKESCKITGRNKGEKNSQWKNGRRLQGNGYIRIFSPSHPFRNSGNDIYEHRLVMEKHIGRYLKSQELVHHKNGIRDDNRIENLILTIKNKNWHLQVCPRCNFEFLIK